MTSRVGYQPRNHAALHATVCIQKKKKKKNLKEQEEEEEKYLYTKTEAKLNLKELYFNHTNKFAAGRKDRREGQCRVAMTEPTTSTTRQAPH